MWNIFFPLSVSKLSMKMRILRDKEKHNNSAPAVNYNVCNDFLQPLFATACLRRAAVSKEALS